MQDKPKGREHAAVSPDDGPTAATESDAPEQGQAQTDANDAQRTSVADDASATDGPGADEVHGFAETPSDEDDKGRDSAASSDEADARYKELSDQYVRLVADFDNFRRRTRANEAAVREQAAANLIKELLPVIDNLQLALAKAETTPEDAFAAGVTLIEQQLTAVLQNHGVQPITTAGTVFDPHFMEAVAQIDGQGQVEPGHVVEELRRGYMLHDKVLRAAQVVVASS